MKKETKCLLSTIFGAKKAGVAAADPSKEIILTSYSQPNVLQQRMQEGKLTHGETVTANLSPVRVEKHMGNMVMYFCPMKSIEVLQTMTDGDGGSLPHQAIVEDLTIPADYKPGFYNLKNVILTSNGTMQVKATGKTVWENAKCDY